MENVQNLNLSTEGKLSVEKGTFNEITKIDLVDEMVIFGNKWILINFDQHQYT